jgi:hypothetical protein
MACEDLFFQLGPVRCIQEGIGLEDCSGGGLGGFYDGLISDQVGDAELR